MKTIIKWAVISVTASLAWLCLEMLLGFHDKLIAYHPYFTMLALIIPVICLRQTIIEHKAAQGGDFSYWQALQPMLLGTLIAACFAPVIQYIFHTLINPLFLKT